MSWFKSTSHSEEVFDEDADDISLQSKEWQSNMKKRVMDGFIDGVDVGEDAALEDGFNVGHREGAEQTVAIGRLKGIACAIWCWCQIQHPESPLPASVTDLLQQVSLHEDIITDGLKKDLENPLPSVSDVSDVMEDLEVSQGDPGCKGEGNVDVDVPHPPQSLSSSSSGSCSNTVESVNQLLQRCMDVVSELGLPQGLIQHLQELKCMDEEVFDEDGDDISLQSKEWQSNMKKRIMDGFVDGIDAGEDAALEDGFKVGHREGAEKTVAIGRLKGIACAIWCWCQIQHPESPLPASVTDLLQQVSRHEDTISDGLKKALEKPIPSVSDVSDIMEDLGVSQGDPGCKGEECEKESCCKGEGCEKENCCKGEGCEKENCCKGAGNMDVDVPRPPQNLSSSSSGSCSNTVESLNQLLQRCMDVVNELGLPQGLIQHLQELKCMGDSQQLLTRTVQLSGT
ncbi:OTU deubiquitinase with linear linkage specificity a [Diretmus argenteus]